MVVREDAPGVSSPAGLSTQMVVVIAGTALVEYLPRQHPNLRVLESETMLAQMSSVLSGRADMMIAALPVVHHFMSENMIAGLRISGLFPSDEIDNLPISVRTDSTALPAPPAPPTAAITPKHSKKTMA